MDPKEDMERIIGRKARLERSEVPGSDRVIYGYRCENNRLIINEEEAQLVRKIYKWYLAS